MNDDDSLYFSFDDQDEDEEEERAQAEEGQNKAFLYGIIALAAIFVLTILLGIGYLLWGRQLLSGGQQAQVSPNELTNNANMTAWAMTEIAAEETRSALAQVTEEPSPEIQTSPTPTSGVDVTVIGTETPEGTEEATEEGTPGAGTEEAETPGAGTQIAEVTPGDKTPTAQGVSGLATPTSIKPTSSIIEVTPIGGSGATPTRSVAGVGGTAVSGATAKATSGGVGGPFQPTVQPTLPTAGFAGGAGLIGAGFLGLALLAVVVITRRIRLK
ncbi:MAG: hypothetical protein JXB30_10825 [Anaerolineae bacterium]|nr:hypothetical protein [Anaerolineae bacterium]